MKTGTQMHIGHRSAEPSEVHGGASARGQNSQIEGRRKEGGEYSIYIEGIIKNSKEGYLSSEREELELWRGCLYKGPTYESQRKITKPGNTT